MGVAESSLVRVGALDLVPSTDSSQLLNQLFHPHINLLFLVCAPHPPALVDSCSICRILGHPCLSAVSGHPLPQLALWSAPLQSKQIPTSLSLLLVYLSLTVRQGHGTPGPPLCRLPHLKGQKSWVLGREHGQRSWTLLLGCLQALTGSGEAARG